MDDFKRAGRLPGEGAREVAARSRGERAVPWLVGAEGEERVAGLLHAGLGPEWAIFHDVTVGSRGANLDHVLVGPPGIFVVNTKHRRLAKVRVAEARVFVNGRDSGYVDASLKEAEVAVARLKAATAGVVAPVWPLIVFTGHTEINVDDGNPCWVPVVADSDVVAWLRQQPERLTAAERQRWAITCGQGESWLPPSPSRRGPTHARERVPGFSDPAILEAAAGRHPSRPIGVRVALAAFWFIVSLLVLGACLNAFTAGSGYHS